MLYISTFSPKEKDRMAEHSLGKKLLEFALDKEYGLKLPELSLNRGSNGKPYLKDFPELHFNISHTDGFAACALHTAAVGVDVELIRPYSKRTASRSLSEAEQDNLAIWETRGTHYASVCFFRYWTLKESYIKATGEGLSIPLNSITFVWDEQGEIKSSIKGFKFYQCCLWNQYILSVCIKQNERMDNSMTYEELFEEIKTMFMKADVSDIKEHLAYEFVIQGEGEGIFYAEVSDGKLSVEPYDYRDHDARFICSADTLLKLAKGKTDPVAAFTLGKLIVEGSIEKALKIQQFLKK